MVNEIEFATMLGETDARDRLLDLLKVFESRERIRVNVITLDLNTGSNDVFQTALHRNGPWVSEISPIWLSSLVGMNALRPVPKNIQQLIGGEPAYLGGLWQSCFVGGSSDQWAVPWTSGTQLIFYRRDLLQAAGVDETTAFKTIESLERTLSALKQYGVARPIVLNTRQSMSTLHRMSSWVWGHGGSFVSEDGQTLLFTSPETVAGMQAFYRLARYMGADAANMDDAAPADLFWRGEAAVVVDGHWVYSGRVKTSDPNLVKNIAFSGLPGVPYIGGSHLAVWQHARNADLAWKLVRFLSNSQITPLFQGPDQMLPARWDIFRSIGMERDAFVRTCAESIDTGRVFTSMRAGMLIENRMAAPLAAIWQEALKNPEADLAEAIHQRIAPVETRLQQTLNAGY